MCVILFALGAHPRYPLVVAANRDEWFYRPTAAAAFWDDAPAVLAGRDLEQWLVMGYACVFAVIGTTLSRRFLDRMSDKQFYHWTRRVILALGSVYVAQGLWLMVTR